MTNIVVVSGQFNSRGTSFADSPVIIEVSGLSWPQNPTSPFTIVRVEVKYDGAVVGSFRADTGQQTKIRFDISSALRNIWSGYSFTDELAAAAAHTPFTRPYRAFTLQLYTEYLAADGYYTVTDSGSFAGGSCALGGMTELERSVVGNADMSVLQFSNIRFGDASTKPTTTPEHVGKDSPTSWVDLGATGTVQYFFSRDEQMDLDDTVAHAPSVLRDSQSYVDFLFLNRRGAIETCSALTKEAMSINTNVEEYSRSEGPTFAPSRTLEAIGSDGRRSWQMSSGYVTREWAEWWATEFIGGKRKRWWMFWQGPGFASARYVPVTIKPAKNDIAIYDKSKQQMAHVDFTVTLGLEG